MLQTEAVLHGQVSDIYGICQEFKWLVRYGYKDRSVATSLLNGVFTHETYSHVDEVYLHVKELEVLHEKITSPEDANASKRLSEQVPLRVMNTEKHEKYLRAWKFKFQRKNLVGVCTTRRRFFDPGISKLFRKILKFLRHGQYGDNEQLDVMVQFGARVLKPPDQNKKLLADETLGKLRSVKKLIIDARFPPKEAYILLGVSQAVAEILCDSFMCFVHIKHKFQNFCCHSGVMLGWLSSGCVKGVAEKYQKVRLIVGITEDDEVLFEKFCSIDSYYKACALLELIYMDIGGKIHNNIVVSHVWHRWKNKTVIVSDSHMLVLEQKWLLHLLHVMECRSFSLLAMKHLSQEGEEFHYSRGMEHDSSSCVRRQDRSCVILLMNASVSVWSERDILASEEKITEIPTEVCYDSQYSSYANIVVSATTLQVELNSVYRLLLGVFLTQERWGCGFFGFLRQWKWYPPEQFYKVLSNRSVRLWTWQEKDKFFASRWLIFGERVASPSRIQGQGCTKLTQPHVHIVICISKVMMPDTTTWSFHDSFIVTEKHKYNGNGATLKLSYLIRDYGDRDIMKLQIICIYIMSLLLFYGSLPRPPEFRTIKKKLKGLKLELKDGVQTSLFTGTRNEDLSSCGTTGQTREEVVSSHVEVIRTIEMFQSKAWIFKYKDKRQERDRNETQQRALKIKLKQSRYCREVQKLELSSMAKVCVDEVFYPQRPPEMLAERDQQRYYDGFDTKFPSSYHL